MSYCNADLKRYYTNIDEYDLKKTLMDEWAVHSANVDVYQDAGAVANLYRDGKDLGDAQASIVACDADGKWFYDSTADALYCYNANDSDTYEFAVSPYDWSDAKSNAITDGAEWLEGMLDNRFPRPLPKNSDGNYDWVLERINGLLACIILIRSTDPTSEVIAQIMSEVTNENENGLLDLLNMGKLKLGFEITKNEGDITTGTTDATTTGFIEGVRGKPSVSWEKYSITIGTGGTLSQGTENTTVTYSVVDSQGNSIITDQFITGRFQPLGGGMEGRFAQGVYVADDTWYLTVTGVPSDTSVVYSMRVKL